MDRKQDRSGVKQDRRTGVNPKGRYTIFSSHCDVPAEKDVMTYITFDPGEYTFDVRVEKRTRGTDGALVETIAQNKHLVNYQREATAGTGTVSFFFSSVTAIIEGYRKHLTQLDIVIVERQMEANTAMMVLQTAIVSYFLFHYPNAFITDISPRLKGDHLGAPAVHDYKQLKAWGVGRALALAEKRGDTWFIAYIEAQRNGQGREKLDDDTDNYMQAEAFCAEVGYQLTGGIVKSDAGPPRLVPTSAPVTLKRARKTAVKMSSSSSEIDYNYEDGEIEEDPAPFDDSSQEESDTEYLQDCIVGRGWSDEDGWALQED